MKYWLEAEFSLFRTVISLEGVALDTPNVHGLWIGIDGQIAATRVQPPRYDMPTAENAAEGAEKHG